MAIGQSAKGSSGSTSSLATGSVNTQATGSTFIVGVHNTDAGALTGLSDNKGNTYTPLGDEIGADPASRLYICEDGTGGSGHIVTATFSPAQAAVVLFLEITSADPLDQNAAAKIDSASPFTSNSITPTAATATLISYIAGDSGSNPATMAESTGFTIAQQETNASSFWAGALAYREVSAIAAYSSSWTQSGAGECRVWIFNLAGAAAGVVVPVFMNQYRQRR